MSERAGWVTFGPLQVGDFSTVDNKWLEIAPNLLATICESSSRLA